jgi:hypothetical protein
MTIVDQKVLLAYIIRDDRSSSLSNERPSKRKDAANATPAQCEPTDIVPQWTTIAAQKLTRLTRYLQQTIFSSASEADPESSLRLPHFPLHGPSKYKFPGIDPVPAAIAPTWCPRLAPRFWALTWDNTLPQLERGVSSSHATRSAALTGIRGIPFCNLQLLSSTALLCIFRGV